VNRVSLGIARGECFGLLGTNGCGKTTTFKMIAGVHGLTTGDIWIGRHSILRAMDEVRTLDRDISVLRVQKQGRTCHDMWVVVNEVL
jgi:ABC-type multidrug transport system ATPase subunit